MIPMEHGGLSDTVIIEAASFTRLNLLNFLYLLGMNGLRKL